MVINRNLSLNQLLFYFGLGLKLLAVFIIFPELHAEYYLKFIDDITLATLIDPWSSHLLSGGDAKNFPFGLAMYISVLPIILLKTLLPFSAEILLKISLLCFDLIIYLLLRKSFFQFTRNILIIYWLSPLVFFITYWHGANDIIPVLFLTISFLNLNSEHYNRAAIFIALAISAKFSMLMIYPIALIYVFLRNKFELKVWYKFLFVSIASLIFLHLPALWSESFLDMAFGASKSIEIFSLVISLSSGLNFYILPFTYLMLLIFFLNMKVVNFELLTTYSFIATFLIIHFINPSFGYYLWLVPYMLFFGLNANRVALTLVMVFSIMITTYHVLFSMGADLFSFELSKSSLHALNLQDTFNGLELQSSLFSLNTFLGVFLSFYFYEIGIRRNDFFKMKKEPILVAISGDSGAGKDTLALSLQDIFHPSKTTLISGDDYHLWERGAKEWKTNTHLSLEANDIEGFFLNSKNIFTGKNIQSKLYDHSTGLFTEAQSIFTNEFIVVSGLHALVPNYFIKPNLSIFLDTTSDLKKFFKLRRDVLERNHEYEKVIESINSRQDDFNSFVGPQIQFADISFQLGLADSIDPENLIEEKITSPRLEVKVLVKKHFYFHQLLNILEEFEDIKITYNTLPGSFASEYIFSGSLSSQKVKEIASTTISKLDLIANHNSEWSSDALGIMQLFTLKYLLRKFED